MNHKLCPSDKEFDSWLDLCNYTTQLALEEAEKIAHEFFKQTYFELSDELISKVVLVES